MPVRWDDIARAEPAFAERVRALFDARKHKTMATLRKDGSPRISGMEVEFRDGDALLGMMGDSCKAKDVLRDPRLAVHSPTVDPPEGDDGTWPGEAKIAGRALEQRGDGPEGTPPGARFFAIDIDEVVLTTIGDPADHLVIESWHPGRGVERRERR